MAFAGVLGSREIFQLGEMALLPSWTRVSSKASNVSGSRSPHCLLSTLLAGYFQIPAQQEAVSLMGLYGQDGAISEVDIRNGFQKDRLPGPGGGCHGGGGQVSPGKQGRQDLNTFRGKGGRTKY